MELLLTMIPAPAIAALMWWRIGALERAHSQRLEALEESASKTSKDVGYVRGVIDAWLHENGHQKG